MSGPGHRLVLVTGATGFIGQALLPHLAANGWQIRAASRHPGSAAGIAGIERVPMPDLLQTADWQPLLAGVTHVVHLAGIAHSTKRLSESDYMRVNAEGTSALARAAAAAGISRFVFLSSVRAQSGPAAAGLLSEMNPPLPTDAYGRSKLAAEQAVRTELGGRAAILRPVLVLGSGSKGNLALLRRLARSPMPLPFGSLDNRRSLLGLGNLVSIVQFALSANVARGRIFLAADPEPMSVRDLIAQMRAAIGRPAGLLPVPPWALATALKIAGQGGLAASLLGELRVDGSALPAAGWRPVGTLRDEITRMMVQDAATSASSR